MLVARGVRGQYWQMLGESISTAPDLVILLVKGCLFSPNRKASFLGLIQTRVLEYHALFESRGFAAYRVLAILHRAPK